jgi:hypothetical protein
LTHRGSCARRIAPVVAAVVTFVAPSPLVAQDVTAAADVRALLLQPLPEPDQERPGSGQDSPLGPAALSLVLPGAGQHVLGQGRKWVYAALEVAGWAVFLERRAKGADARDRYKDYAWAEGRIQSGPRMDGVFAYYETMSKWTASGAFDTDPDASGVQPEPDPSTYNGSIWARAEQIYVGGGPVPETDPAYRSALAYYSELAYHTGFLWDWSGVPGGKDRLADLIEATDDRFREATTALGAVIANHLVSAADAYLAARGRSAPMRLTIVPDRRPGGGWSAVVSIPVGPVGPVGR